MTGSVWLDAMLLLWLAVMGVRQAFRVMAGPSTAGALARKGAVRGIAGVMSRLMK